ncbi:MAG: DUF6577 family protein [Candidatus Bathyarchaeia archaeon]|jgi:hypothetical protein
MKWTSTALDHLKAVFGQESFTTKQATAALKREMGYSHNASYQILHGLVREGLLTKFGRGLYSIAEKKAVQTEAITISDKLIVTLTSGVLIRAEQVLKEKGVEFMITGPSALAGYYHLLPRRLIHLIYVIDGAGEFASTILKKENFLTLLNPRRGEVEMGLETFGDRDVFVIREFAELPGNINGRAVLEKALVDVYFEATRRRIPFPELEVGRIMANAFRTEKIEIARLLSLAARRGVKGEIQSIVKVLVPVVPLPAGVKNEKVMQVLRGAME